MKICYIDEAGCLGALPSTNSDIQPALVIVGVIIDYQKLYLATEQLLNLKQKWFPGNVRPLTTHLGRILSEVKGSELRKHACAPGRNLRRQTFGFLDSVVSLCEQLDAKIVGRIWIKGIGESFDGRAVYTSSVQAMAAYFHDYLARQADLGVMIADSRIKHLNTQVAHSIFTQKFKGTGDLYDRMIELPVFGHSDNHACLQIADILCSAIITPMAVETYCSGHLTGVHIRPQYKTIKDKYAARINAMQHRYQQLNGRWQGGLTVSDSIGQKSGSRLFRLA